MTTNTAPEGEKTEPADWEIYFDPPPIPTRNCDWHFHHKDFDGAPDANDHRCGHGASYEDCLDQIADMDADQ
jgi:hypothetical protein